MTRWVSNPATINLGNGTDLTPANSACPDVWSEFFKGGPGSTIDWYEPGEFHFESRPGANEYAQARRYGISFNQVSFEQEHRGDPAPNIESRLIEFRASGEATGRAGFINVGTDNKLRVYNRDAQLLHTFTTVLPSAGEGWRVHAGIDPGTTATDGIFHVHLYIDEDGKTTTPTGDSYEASTVNVGTTPITEIRAGWVSDAEYKLRVRNTQMEDTSIAPLGPLSTTSVTLGPDQEVEPLSTVNLTATHNGGDVPDSWSWTQASGPAVTLTPSGNTCSFTAPAHLDGTSVVIGCTPSSGGTVGDEDQVTVNALPHLNWARLDGVNWEPVGPMGLFHANLIVNGLGHYGDTTNFPITTFDPADVPAGSPAKGSFYTTPTAAAGQLLECTSLAKVDTTSLFTMSFWLRQRAAGQTTAAYGGLKCWDRAGSSIAPYHYMWQANTTTTLAQPLNPGDTVVYLTSAANWNNAAGASTHFRTVIFWNWEDAFGTVWPQETYSRNVTVDAYDDGAVNFTANTVTLRAAYAGPALPAGTPVSNGSSGSSYLYGGIINGVVPESWTQYQFTVQGVHVGPSYATDAFPPGTDTVSPIFLLNRFTAESRHALAEVTLKRS